MTFIPDSTLQAAVAARLKRVGIDIANSAYWPTIITDANNNAYSDIIRLMGLRGYTATDLALWSDAVRFNTRIGIWYAINDGGIGDAFKADQLDKLDERDRLWNDDWKGLTIPISSATGLVIYPSQQQVITTGEWQHHVRQRPTLDHTGECGPGTNTPPWNEGPDGGCGY